VQAIITNYELLMYCNNFPLESLSSTETVVLRLPWPITLDYMAEQLPSITFRTITDYHHSFCSAMYLRGLTYME